jgi:putative endonuclease
MHAWWRQQMVNLADKWNWFWGQNSQNRTEKGAIGRFGEESAARFLQNRGWKVVVRNWRHGRDELDIVAWDGTVLVFVEVRTRSSRALVSGYHSVTKRKKRALARAAKAYLRGMPSSPAHFRFDILEVKVSDGGQTELLLHSGIPLFSQNF